MNVQERSSNVKERSSNVKERSSNVKKRSSNVKERSSNVKERSCKRSGTLIGQKEIVEIVHGHASKTKESLYQTV